MNCFDFQELISAKLDKELTKEEERLLSEHLKICTDCANFAKELEELKVTTSTWKNEQIPSELEKRILKHTLKISPKEKPVLSFLKGYYKVPKSLAWASIILFLMLLINSFLNQVGPTTGISKFESTVQEEPKSQRIVLTEKDVLRTYVILGKKN